MAAVNLALVIVPTLLMGATLPVLVGHLVRRTGNVGSAVGLLYYVNTLGAGAACLVCTLLLFPFLGMQGALLVAVALNAAVAIGALVAHWRDRKVETPVMTDALRARAAPQAAHRLCHGARARGRRRLRLLVLRNLLLPHRVLCVGLERDRLCDHARARSWSASPRARGRPASIARRSRAER